MAVTPAPAPSKPPPASPAPTKPDARPLVPVATTGSGGVIKLRFKGKSWVEVRDSRGQVLLTGLNDAGSETEVSGRPPFKVVVGNAPDVRLFFNDRELDLEPHMRDAVARVTVE
jgi:cytoskeleton protein RodZ